MRIVIVAVLVMMLLVVVWQLLKPRVRKVADGLAINRYGKYLIASDLSVSVKNESDCLDVQVVIASISHTLDFPCSSVYSKWIVFVSKSGAIWIQSSDTGTYVWDISQGQPERRSFDPVAYPSDYPSVFMRYSR